MGIHKAPYNHISKISSLFKPKNLRLYAQTEQKNIYPSTYTKEKSGTSMRRQNKKDLHIHAQRNEGCSPHPDQFVLCMYV